MIGGTLRAGRCLCAEIFSVLYNRFLTGLKQISWKEREPFKPYTKTTCTVLFCTVLYCIVLYCTVLYCTVLYCTVHCTRTVHILRGTRETKVTEEAENKTFTLCSKLGTPIQFFFCCRLQPLIFPIENGFLIR